MLLNICPMNVKINVRFKHNFSNLISQLINIQYLKNI